MDNDIERQKKLEADSVQDGLLRYAKSYEYHLATDSKPVRDVLGHCLKPLADVIRAEQLRKFLEEQRQASPDLDLPEPPQAGDLDIRQVIESPYFFA